MNNNFRINLIAILDKTMSKRMIKNDLKSFDGQLFVKVIANINKTLSKRALTQSLRELTNLNVSVKTKLNQSTSEAQLKKQIKTLQTKIEDLDIRLKANTGQLKESVKQAGVSAQKIASQTPIEYKVLIKKDKLVSDLSLLAKQNSKLFTNSAATQKYGKLLNDAYNASTSGDIKKLTLGMAAFKNELKATNLSGLTLTDTFKKAVGRTGELISATSMVAVAYSQARKAYTEVNALDDSMTGLYKVADEINSREDFPAYLDKSIKKARELAVETKSLISSVTNWKKIGFSLGLSEELAEVSTKLEKTGDMSIEKAMSTLISTIQAFKEIDGLTEEQYSERALAIADKINNISNTRGIDAEEISDALKNSATTLQEGNNDLNQSIAMIAAGNQIFQSPSEAGNMLKTVSMRLRGLTEDGEKAEESVAMLQETILNLTNGNVDIMLDENTFKSTYDILLEISKVYNSLSDNSQSLLLEKIAGNQSGVPMAAMLQNMSEAEEIYKDVLNSVGSVEREFQRYQEGASAAITRFKETLVYTYTGILSGDMTKSIANVGTSILDLVNKFNLLQSSLVGIAATGAVKSIVAISTACVSTAMQMSTLGDAIKQIDSLPIDAGKRKTALVNIGKASKSLSDSQNKLLLSNKALSQSDRMYILSGQDVVRTKQKEKLATLGLTQVTEGQAVANVKAATSTFSLKAALTGLGATMKAVFLSNPIGISLMAISVGIGAVSGKYHEFKQAIDDARQTSIEAADAAAMQANKLNELYMQYENLAGVTERTSSQEQEFKTAIEQITLALGNKAEVLEGLTVGTEEYSEALKEATRAEIEEQYAAAVRGRKAAEDTLHDATWSTWSGSKIDVPLNVNMTGVEKHVQALGIVRTMLSDFEKETSQGIKWAPEHPENMDSVVEYYSELVKARERLTLQSKALNNDAILESDIYKNIDKIISDVSESVKTYTKNKYEELKLEYEYHNGIPTTVEGFNSMKDALLNASGAGEGLKRVYNDLLSKDFSSLATQAIQEVPKVSDGKTLLPWTEDQNKKIDEYQSKIKSLIEAKKSLADGTMTKSGALDLIQEYGIDPSKVEMSTGAFIGLREELERIAKLSLNNISSKLGEMLKGGFIDESAFTMLSQIFHDMAYNIDENTNSLSTWKKQLQDSRSSISDISVILKDLDENGINNLSSSSVDKIISNYPSLLSYLSNEKELRNGLNQELERQETSSESAYINMMQADETFYQQILQNESNKVAAVNNTINSIVNGNAQLVNMLGGYYNTDLGNFKSLAEAKAKIEETLIKNCAAAWAKYYQVQVVDGVATTNALDGGVHSGEEAAARSAAIASTSAYNQAIKSLDSLANISIGVADIGKIDSKGNGGNSQKAKEEQKKVLDWIPAALDHVEKERQKVVDIIEDENVAYEKQLSLTHELLANDEEVIRVNKEALDIYLSQWEAVRQKIIEAFGETEGNALISKIMMGSTSSEDWRNEFSYDPDDKTMAAKMKLLEDGEEAFATFTKQDEKYKNKVEEHTEDLKRQFEIRVNIIKESLEDLKSEMSQIESEISLKEITGRIITESDYRDMINLADGQIDLQYEQIDALEEYLDELDEGSAEWYNVKSQISSCKDAIRQCEENQAKWNEEILNLPVRRIERYLELLGFIKQDLRNFIDEQSSLGKDTSQEQLQKLIELSSKQIEKLNEEHEELVKKLSNYDYGSDKFNEVQKSIQDCENEMSSLIQEQIQYNKQILDIPLNKINDLKEQLNSIKGALDSVTGDYDTAISAVINTIEKEIDSYNDMKEAAEESCEARIKPLQDELDLLNKTNEARQIQLDAEQSLYDLERAKNQKTTQVVENGEIVYREDIDAVRNANKAHEDALYNKAKYELEQQIESLEKERDELLESYDGQIDKLNEIKDRWSEIADNIRDANEAVHASDILGAGWEDKVTTGNDKDIYDAMVKNYEAVEAQKEMYQKQIDAAEKVSSLMEQYIAAFQSGTMSYQDVLSKFDELILAAKDGFSSQEYLDALLNVSGNSDTASALENIQSQISGSYEDFKAYLQAAHSNSELISKYTSTWEEIKKTLEEQLVALKKMAEEEAKKVSDSKPSSGGKGGKGHSSSKGPNWNTPDRQAEGPAKEIEEREKAKNSHKDGLESSPVGRTVSSNTELIRTLGLRKLNPEEIASILHEGEVVVNPEQIDQVAENFNALEKLALSEEQKQHLLQYSSQIPVSLPEFTPFKQAYNPSATVKEFNFNMGDINLNSVDNTQKLVDTIAREFDSALCQKFSKY